LAEHLVAEVTEAASWLARPAVKWSVEAWAQAEARAALVDAWLDERATTTEPGDLDEDGAVRPASLLSDRRHCGACPSTARSLPPLPKSGVVVETRQEKTNVVNGIASTLDPQYPTGKIAEHGGRHSLRVVGCLCEAGEGMGQDLRSDPLRAGCTQEYRDHPATAVAEDGGSVGTCRVEHRLRVADRVLDARWRGQRYWVREPDAAGIEADQPAEGGEAALKLEPPRLLVPYFDRDVGPTGGLEQIDRPVPDHLVSDMRAV